MISIYTYYDTVQKRASRGSQLAQYFLGALIVGGSTGVGVTVSGRTREWKHGTGRFYRIICVYCVSFSKCSNLF